MHILRLSTLSLTFVLFTLGTLILPVNTALAEHCRGMHKNDDGCDVSRGGGAETTYTVNMVVNRFNSQDAHMCTGTADKRLGPSFEPHSCKIVLNDSIYGEREYCLFGVSVKNTNKGTRVMLFMTRVCDFVNSTGDDNYHTLELAGTLVLDNDTEGGPDFHITVDYPADGAVLTKIHQPNKNVALTDKIDIGDLVYTVDP